jgi:hypothetical protein
MYVWETGYKRIRRHFFNNLKFFNLRIIYKKINEMKLMKKFQWLPRREGFIYSAAQTCTELIMEWSMVTQTRCLLYVDILKCFYKVPKLLKKKTTMQIKRMEISDTDMCVPKTTESTNEYDVIADISPMSYIVSFESNSMEMPNKFENSPVDSATLFDKFDSFLNVLCLKGSQQIGFWRAPWWLRSSGFWARVYVM